MKKRALWMELRPLLGALIAISAAVAGACSGSSGTTAQTFDPAQVPPTTSDALDAWVANTPWTKWTCEPAPRPARLSSPHGMVRVCENDLLVNAAASSADLPVGASAVKEMYSGDTVWSYTIAVRGKSGASAADRWFWWRKVIDGSQTPPITNASYGDGYCSGCHATAGGAGGRDYVFTMLTSSP